MTWRKREIMNEQERELDFMVGELEQENRLLRARNDRLEAERGWVGLTSEDYNEIFEKARTGEHAVQLAEIKLRDQNT